jgi:hypothetical protein
MGNFWVDLTRSTLYGAPVALGGILYLGRYGSQLPHYHVFSGEPSDLGSVRGSRHHPDVVVTLIVLVAHLRSAVHLIFCRSE